MITPDHRYRFGGQALGPRSYDVGDALETVAQVLERYAGTLRYVQREAEAISLWNRAQQETRHAWTAHDAVAAKEALGVAAGDPGAGRVRGQVLAARARRALPGGLRARHRRGRWPDQRRLVRRAGQGRRSWPVRGSRGAVTGWGAGATNVTKAADAAKAAGHVPAQLGQAVRKNYRKTFPSRTIPNSKGRSWFTTPWNRHQPGATPTPT